MESGVGGKGGCLGSSALDLLIDNSGINKYVCCQSYVTFDRFNCTHNSDNFNFFNIRNVREPWRQKGRPV